MTEQDKKELESLLMVMNGILLELEHNLLESNMTKENKILKSFIYLEEIENYSGKTRKLLNRIFSEEN